MQIGSFDINDYEYYWIIITDSLWQLNTAVTTYL